MLKENVILQGRSQGRRSLIVIQKTAETSKNVALQVPPRPGVLAFTSDGKCVDVTRGRGLQSDTARKKNLPAPFNTFN